MKKYLLEAFLGFVLWTTILTPYMVFIVQTTLEQYISWFFMQSILVPIIAPVVFRITKYVEGKVIGLDGKKYI